MEVYGVGLGEKDVLGVTDLVVRMKEVGSGVKDV